MLDNLSVVVICKNAASTIGPTLESVREFAEVVVYDNGSTDETIRIAEQYQNVSVHSGSFEGFGKTKQKATGLAKHDWVFSLDADESVSPELLDELKTWSPDSASTVGVVLRRNRFMGVHVRHGSWANDWIVRLFNRTSHSFNANLVHESVETGNQTQKLRLSGAIDHNAVQDIGQFLRKIDHYSEIRRNESSETFHPAVIFFRAIGAFIKSYFVHLGFLDGWRGLVIAWNDANGTFYKYIKRYADRVEQDKSQAK